MRGGVEVRGLARAFDGFEAVRGIDLDVAENKVSRIVEILTEELPKDLQTKVITRMQVEIANF